MEKTFKIVKQAARLWDTTEYIQYLIIKFLCFPQIGDVSKSLVSIKMSWMALENLGRLVSTSLMHNSKFKD